MSTDRRPPFRAEHVGSFVRPERLLQAARAHRAGELEAAAYREVQDDCIREVIAWQDAIGMPSVTDGEFRRRSWSAGVIDALDGFGLREEGALQFQNESGKLGVAASPYAKAPLSRRGRIVADDFAFVRDQAPSGLAKATMASPPVMHFYLGPRSFETDVYADRDAYFAALAAIYRDEIADLAAEGCTYLQLDETALPCNCDDTARAAVRERGEDPDDLTDAYIRLINDALAGRPAGMTVALHMCRGNLKGAWMAEGGYEPIAERMFGGLDVDAYFMEYDTPRAGDFGPLRHMPSDKTVVLGLISTKTPDLEPKDEIKRRINEAAKFVPLERLALSPQCGFSSGGGGGQVVTNDDARRKLELVLEISGEVWD
jgi:5-methyltetrahydropteroyltriglutamate--homocysteine methyltransferase